MKSRQRVVKDELYMTDLVSCYVEGSARKEVAADRAWATRSRSISRLPDGSNGLVAVKREYGK